MVPFTQSYQYKDKLIEGVDESALLQVINQLNPVVVIDESHNFEADLRVELLNQLNPCFILDLTATPRKKSNIICFVDAMRLKKANMVKLPVIVYNHESVNDVIVSSITLQHSLEAEAIEAEKETGRYIRPIVLFQAQPNTDDESETFGKIKKKLIEIGIPEEQIKIKTAQINEIKDIDLMDKNCKVRYIITVNALKEGWDCPFAYILASLANRTSKVDVEQILGRILRLPYTSRNSHKILNLSYVFTSSSDFSNTLNNIILSLNNAGFSSKDYRTVDTETTTAYPKMPEYEPSMFSEPNNHYSSTGSEEDPDAEIKIETGIIKEALAESQQKDKNPILSKAIEQSDEYDNHMQQSDTNNIPVDIMDKIKSYTMKDYLKPMGEKIVLPIFMYEVANASIFEDEKAKVLLTPENLMEGFDLMMQDKIIDFASTATEGRLIDLELRSEKDSEYVPKSYVLNSKDMEYFKNYFESLAPAARINQFSKRIAKLISRNAIAEPKYDIYINSVLQNIENSQLSELVSNEANTVVAFRNKIKALSKAYMYTQFKKLLDTEKITCSLEYKLPTSIEMTKKSIGISKGLYTEEDGDMNDFEVSVITKISSLSNVEFWHRNQERGKGYYINGFINHYPDFIVKLKSGKILLIETKGDDRDNSDSKMKLELGTTIANKAGDNYRYYMVYDKNIPDGAVSVASLIDRISNF